ncbi:MAG: hypothetical protein QOD93_6712 [Acetobacteraceae bacterium]|jgi:hypothetical protein|nr:hypothetical protein [Acetobacteraceae bacterium]
MRFFYLGPYRCNCFPFGIAVYLGIMYCFLVALPANAIAQAVLSTVPYPVGMTQVEFTNAAEGRPLDYMLIYPTTPDGATILSEYSCPLICICTRTRR